MDDPTWMAVLVVAIPALAGILSTFLSSDHAIMRVIDLLAFNWGKARNDPGAQ